MVSWDIFVVSMRGEASGAGGGGKGSDGGVGGYLLF